MADDAFDASGLLGKAEQLHRTAGWDPKPLRRSEEPDEFPVHRLPPVIRGAVREVARYVQAPLAMVVASALSVVSAAVQTRFSVSRDARMHGPSSLFFLTVAESGERKSTVDKMFMQPVRTWEARQRKLAKERKEEFDEALRAWESAEAGQKGDRPEPPPITPTMLRGDDTSEALVSHLVQYPIAAVISAEAGVIFGSYAMNPENVQRNLALANALWDGGPVMEGRIKRGEINIQSARVTMGLMLQPKILESFVGRANGMARGIGYLARFLFCYPESTQGTRMYSDPLDMPALDLFHQRVSQLLDYHAVFDELGELSTCHMTLDERASDAWIGFYNDVEDQIGADSEYSRIRDVASKAAENAARIACCLQVFAEPAASKIGRDIMNDACALMSWYLHEAARFGRAADVTEELRHAEILEEWLIDRHKKAHREKTGWSMTVNMVRRLGPNVLRGGKRVDDALELLKDHGRIRLLRLDGSKSVQIIIAPQVIQEYS